MDLKSLKDRKKTLKLTTKEVAILADLPVSTVSKIMTGETKNPSFLTIEKIDKALLHEEMLRRVQAYKDALNKYYLNNYNENVLDYNEFEKMYRAKNNLDNEPIPYAKPISTNEDGNLAREHNLRLDIHTLYELGEDKNMELIDGHLVIGHAPNTNHQMIVQKIGKIIDRYIDEHGGKCKLFNVGINVFIDEDDYSLLIPDIAVLCDVDKLKDDGIHGSPDLVIEVTSKSTRSLDYNDKMHKYMHAGVREYWIVDPDTERVTVYIDGEPMLAYVYNFHDNIPVNIYAGELEICISD